MVDPKPRPALTDTSKTDSVPDNPVMGVKERSCLFYALAFIIAALAYRFVVNPWLPSRVFGDPNKVLEMNAALLVAAFALVITVVLVVAQLAGGLGIARAVRPPQGLLWAELVAFAVAIAITLLGRYVALAPCKSLLMHVSSFLTLLCLLVLPPYFWRQRQHISTREVVADAFSKSTQGGSLSGPVFMDVLLSAAKRGDYLLFRDGIEHLRDRAAGGEACREYLEGIRGHLSNDSGDGYALGIVDSALLGLDAKASVDTANHQGR